MNVNIWDVTPEIENLIRSKKPVDLARLADPGVALDDVMLHQPLTAGRGNRS